MTEPLTEATPAQLVAAVEAVEALASSYEFDPERRFCADNAAGDIRRAINYALGRMAS